jgi:hypothetical protein
MSGRPRFTAEEQREKARLYSAAYHQDNRELIIAKMRERNRRYYAENRERLIKRAAEYQRANPEKRNGYKSAWNRQKKLTDPQFAAITMMRKLVARTCERIKVGRREIGRTAEALGYNTEEFRRHIEAQFRDGMSWANHGEWHIDHVRPLSSFDLTNPEQRKAANALSNLQPLWAAENMAKGARQDFKNGNG